MKPQPNIISWFLVPALLGLAALPAGAQATPAPPTSEQVPTLAQIQALRLRDGFTLTYTVVETDIRSPELKAAQAAGVVRDYQRMVTQGSCTQAAAGRMIKMEVGCSASAARSRAKSSRWTCRAWRTRCPWTPRSSPTTATRPTTTPRRWGG